MNRRPVLLQQSTIVLYWAIVVASLWILLRGHNEPGGGFVAGLMAAMATVVRAMGAGLAAAERSLPLRSPLRLGAAGALLSLVSGLPALLAARPYLAHLSTTLPGGFKLSTFLPFDIGIYLAVWGVLAGFILTLLDLDPPDEARS